METLIQGIALGLAFGGVFALMAAGITPIFAVTRQINVAHGTFMVLALYFVLAFYTAFKLDPYISFFIVAPLMLVLGLLVFRFTFKRVIHADHLMVFQFFIGYVFIVEYALVLWQGADFRAVESFIGLHKLYIGPYIFRMPQIMAVLAAFVVCLGGHWMLMKTEFGCSIRAAAQDDEVAALMGIDLGRLRLMVFGMGFILMAIAGTMMAPFQHFNPFTGFILTLFALVKLVMGGMGSFLGILVAGLIIGLVYGLSYTYIPSSLAAVGPYLFFVQVMLWRPQGLVTRR